MLNTVENSQIVLPRVSSIRREYIPADFLSKECIITDAAQLIPEAEPYVFSILNSKMHTSWVESFAGKLKSDYRYSAGICWYSFPFPEISDSQREELTSLAFSILQERAKFPEKNLAELYDPKKMPESLRAVHQANDQIIDLCYGKRFRNNEERLAELVKQYGEMTGAKNA